ncbi:VWA domain-containing protein [Falsihalocynthiibacter sp. SS001]|uniref:VWA domain-containing protein n=1 Tax=Falsihalocynthiibacter sp. SS001 TaxID=3349698 RepID=UPI0036D36AAB
MLTLALPFVLLLLPLPLLIWRKAPPHKEISSAVRIPFFQSLTKAAGISQSTGAIVRSHTRVQLIASALVWGLVVLGLARPEKLGEPITIETSARDLVLAVDISGSMDTRDMEAPNGTAKQRLEVVKDVVADFIAEREGDRVALIIFGSSAYLQAPFTEDLETAAELLNQTQVGMAGPHTAIGDAIGLSLNTFEGSDVESKLIILLSDGTDTNSRMTPLNAADIAARQGVSISTIAVGDENAEGENRVDVATLEEIARRANGSFYFANDAEGLSEIYDEIDQQNPRVIDSAEYQPRESLAHIPLALALCITLATLLWLFIASRFRRQHA